MQRSIRHKITGEEQSFFATVCTDALFDKGDAQDQEHLVNTAAKVAGRAAIEIPILAKAIRSLRTLRTSPGLLILENLPTIEDPRRLLFIVGSILGKIAKYDNEGDYLIEIKEVKTNPGDRPSGKNAREFYFHTDLSYVPNPPTFLLMHSIVNNPGEGGLSLFSDIERATSNLSALDVAELQRQQFLFPAPPHFKGGGVVNCPILTTNEEENVWRLRFRRDNLRAQSRTGIEAVVGLIKAIDDCAEEVLLETNSLVLLDNQSFLHGRTAFAGGAESAKQPRHLNRIYVNL